MPSNAADSGQSGDRIDSHPHPPLKSGSLLLLVWRLTGGWKAFLRSSDLWISLFVWAVSWHAWTRKDWWIDVIATNPSLLGFTLAGFAIFLGFGSEDFKKLIAERQEERSQYLSVSAAFLYFVMVQVAGLLCALVAKATYFDAPHAFGGCVGSVLYYGGIVFWAGSYFLYVFGILLAFRAAMRIFRLSRWYHSFMIL